MSSTFARALRYDLVDELDELYEAVLELVGLIEDAEYANPDASRWPAMEEVIAAADRVEGRVAVLDSAGGHEHGDPGELDSKGGFRNG